MKTPVEGMGTGKGADWLMRRSMQSSVAARHCSVVRAALSFRTIPFAAAELRRGFAPGMRPTLHTLASAICDVRGGEVTSTQMSPSQGGTQLIGMGSSIHTGEVARSQLLRQPMFACLYVCGSI